MPDVRALRDAPVADRARADGAGAGGAGGARVDGGITSDAPSSAGPAAGQCTTNADCLLVNDCCSCVAIAKSDKGPACDRNIKCVTSTCAQFGGIDAARCIAGRCVLGFDCDTSSVACLRAPPVCLAGQVPRAVGAGAGRCYGECVDARQCISVPTCNGCAGGDLCVRYAGAAQTLHCVPAPLACGANLGCGCAAATVCMAPHASCQATPAGSPRLTCVCPGC